jgi:hypothetical protein
MRPVAGAALKAAHPQIQRLAARDMHKVKRWVGVVRLGSPR